MKTVEDLKRRIRKIETLSEELWNFDFCGSFDGMYLSDRTERNTLMDDGSDKADRHNEKLYERCEAKFTMVRKLFRSLKAFDNKKVIAQYNYECASNSFKVNNDPSVFEFDYLKDFINDTEENSEWCISIDSDEDYYNDIASGK